jgi:hypothetical protein
MKFYIYFMEKPEVRIIETQYEEVRPAEISGWERDQILAKYGYTNQSSNQQQSYSFDPTRDLSYQEMMELEDRRIRMEYEKRNQEMTNRPRTYSIDNDQVRYNERKWSSMDLGGQDFGVEVQIVSDMKFT